MPNWSHDPPERGEGPALPIQRTPSARPLVATITSPDMIGCDTHFYQGHTVPCEKPECEACGKGIPFRWHGYLAALNYDSHLHFIFEMTLQASRALVEYRDAHSTLRGCLFKAYRLHRRHNGRVIIQTKPAAIEHINLPKPPDLVSCMAIIWQLPRPEVILAGKFRAVDRVATLDHIDEIRQPGNNKPVA